jgi:hypothetical protein
VEFHHVPWSVAEVVGIPLRRGWGLRVAGRGEPGGKPSPEQESGPAIDGEEVGHGAPASLEDRFGAVYPEW